MPLADELLDQAQYLLQRNPGSPKQADLRRAVSSAYYSVFHLLSSEAAGQVGPGLAPEVLSKTQRTLEHGVMVGVATAFKDAGNDKLAEKGIVLSKPISVELANIAGGFRRLQEERHRADYDVLAVFDHVTVREIVATAQSIFNDWQNERNTENARVFLASLVFWKLWKKY